MRSSTNTKDTNNNAKKAEEISKMIETLRKLGSNKQCFDCGEKVKKNLDIIFRELLMLLGTSELLYVPDVQEYIETFLIK
jgi:hypothetical protein